MEQKEIKNTVFELKKDGFYMDGECLFSFDYMTQEEIKLFKKDFEKIISYKKEKEIKKWGFM